MRLSTQQEIQQDVSRRHHDVRLFDSVEEFQRSSDVQADKRAELQKQVWPT